MSLYSILHHEVPISLEIRVAYLQTAPRLEIKAPPSDQILLAFTFVTDIDLNLDSSVGEHKITNGHVALFLINRFKASIRETMIISVALAIYLIVTLKNQARPPAPLAEG